MTSDTLQQRMALAAYKNVSDVQAAYPEKDEPYNKKYGSMAHKLPILIYSAGLAQALAFVEARGAEAQHTLLDHVAQTLEMPGIADRTALAREAREADLLRYMLLTRRTLAALLWYKRFAESILKVTPAEAARVEDDADSEAQHDR